MSSVADVSARRAAPALGAFERYLTLWVALCIIAGVLLGQLMPAPFQHTHSSSRTFRQGAKASTRTMTLRWVSS